MSADVITELMNEYNAILNKMIDTKNRYVTELGDLLAIDPPTDEADNMIVEYDNYISKQSIIIEQYQSFVDNIDNYAYMLDSDIITGIDALDNDREYGRRIGNIIAKYGTDGITALNTYFSNNGNNALLLVDYANKILLRKYL